MSPKRKRKTQTERAWTFGDPATLSLSLDVADLLDFADEAEGQMAFAMSLALNKVTPLAVEDLQRRLPGPFTIRNTWTARGIVWQESTKRDLKTKIGSIRPYMRLQAKGGDRVHQHGQQWLIGVPIGARPTRQAKTTISKMPSRIIAKKTGWLGPLRKKSKLATWKIEGGKKRKNQRLVLMYSMMRKARVPKAWDLEGQLSRVISRTWEKAATAALERAIKTRRK